MSHAVLFLTYLQVPEQLSLAQEAWASLVAQDVGQLEIWAVNNGGSAEAKEWIDTLPNPNNSIIHPVHYEVNWPPTIVVNMMLAEIFEKERSRPFVPTKGLKCSSVKSKQLGKVSTDCKTHVTTSSSSKQAGCRGKSNRQLKGYTASGKQKQF